MQRFRIHRIGPASSLILSGVLSLAGARMADAQKTAEATPQQTDAVNPFQPLQCTPKTGTDLEREFCRNVAAQMAGYKPAHVAPNRTLAKTVVEFGAWSYEARITLASVLVKDPIGKNTVKLIFSPPVDTKAAATQTILALDRILEIRATVQNVGWIIVVPADATLK